MRADSRVFVDVTTCALQLSRAILAVCIQNEQKMQWFWICNSGVFNYDDHCTVVVVIHGRLFFHSKTHAICEVWERGFMRFWLTLVSAQKGDWRSYIIRCSTAVAAAAAAAEAAAAGVGAAAAAAGVVTAAEAVAAVAAAHM